MSDSPRGLCDHCGKRLVPVGHERLNGKNHQDWPSRRLHKKCWLIQQKIAKYQRYQELKDRARNSPGILCV